MYEDVSKSLEKAIAAFYEFGLLPSIIYIQRAGSLPLTYKSAGSEKWVPAEFLAAHWYFPWSENSDIDIDNPASLKEKII